MSQKVFVGQQFKLNCGILVTVVDYKNTSNVVIECAEGYSKTVPQSYLITGSISWNWKNKAQFNAGDFVTLACGTIVEITSIDKFKKIVLRSDSGLSQVCSITQLKSGKVTWEPNKYKERNRKYYIYAVMLNDVIVYIGKGSGNRYDHPNSGCSHVYEFNKMHFSGITLVVTKLLDNLYEKEALEQEAILIKSHSPMYNSVHNRH